MASMKELGLDRSNVIKAEDWINHPIDIVKAESTNGKFGKQVRLTIHAVGTPDDDVYLLYLAENPRRIALVQHFSNDHAEIIHNVVMLKLDVGKGNPAFIFVDYDEWISGNANPEEESTG